MIPNLRSSSPDVFEQNLTRRALVLRAHDFAAAVHKINRQRAKSQTPSEPRVQAKPLSTRERARVFAKSVESSVLSRPKPQSTTSALSQTQALLDRLHQGLQRHDEDRQLVFSLFN